MLLAVGVAGAVVVAVGALLLAVIAVSLETLSQGLRDTTSGPCDDPERALWFAAAYGDLELLADELEPALLDAQAQGRTPLLCAAVDGQVAAVELLLDAGADPDLQVDGTTALHQAVEHEQVEVIGALVEGGADLEVRNEEGATPLVLAARGGAEQVEALLAVGADPTTVCQIDGREVGSYLRVVDLAMASHSDDPASVRDAPEIEQLAPLGRGRGPTTALHAAALAGEAETVRLLLQAGGDPNAVAYGAYTPLHATEARRAMDLAVAELYGDEPALDTDKSEQIEALLLFAGADPALAPDPTVGAPADLAGALQHLGGL
jgi:ankyrin repeat protein